MAKQHLQIRSVAIIGAGVSGVSAAVYLKKAGLDVTVFERSSRAGGVWVFDERVAKDAPYPSTLPSIGDSPDEDPTSKYSSKRSDSPIDGLINGSSEDAAIRHAPPGPCYQGLKNNVSTIEMELQCQSWKPGTEEFVPHHVLADYIQDAAKSNDVNGIIKYNTRVEHIDRTDPGWKIETTRLEQSQTGIHFLRQDHTFDAVVIASGHYHACNIPDIKGLAQWKQAFPERVQHSKLYRRPDQFKDRNVLIIGSGVSSLDIAKELGDVAKTVYQVSRGGIYDLPSHLLPANAARVGAIRSFDALPTGAKELDKNGAIPATVTLESGQKLCNIHHVIVATGYHVSFPFMRQYHADGLTSDEADDRVLVTDGQQTHNLHKDIFYIPDPTLAFVGVPYHVATFSFFEFQAMALAQIFAGIVPVPSEQDMREEYRKRLSRKGAGRTFHSLKDDDDEIGYVDDLVKLVNEGCPEGEVRMTGHSVRWHEAYARRGLRKDALFSAKRDPSIDEAILNGAGPCS